MTTHLRNRGANNTARDMCKQMYGNTMSQKEITLIFNGLMKRQEKKQGIPIGFKQEGKEREIDFSTMQEFMFQHNNPSQSGGDGDGHH